MNESPYEHRIKMFELCLTYLTTVDRIVSSLVVHGDIAQYEVRDVLDHVRTASNGVQDHLTDCRFRDHTWKANHHDGSESG